jgi:hypothetical protein
MKEPRERWERFVREYVVRPPAEMVEEIVDHLVAADATGTPSNVWHEVHEYQKRHDNRMRCELCGARGRFIRESETGVYAHELCKARARLGQETPPLPEHRPCPCARCERERKRVSR